MQPTPIVRPSWLALHGKTLLSVVSLGAIGATAAWVLDREPAPAKAVVQAVPSIVTVQVPVPGPALSPPAVNVTVQAPPVPEPAHVVPPPPRALTPFLDADCIARTDLAEEERTRCAWHDGFPAISSDGKTIAVRYSVDDGGRGWLNVAVRFVDVETSKVLADHPIVTPDDLDEMGEATDKTRALAKKRVAPIQKRLDTGRYRTMAPIESVTPEPDLAAMPGLRFEHAQWETSARIVDGDANVVLWRGEFLAATEYPPRTNVSEDEIGCYPSSTNDVSAWIDPATRLVAFQVSYGSGPCYCSDEVHHYVRRAATP